MALVAAIATLVDLVWARDATNPVWKLDIRVSYWLIGMPLVIGIVYYGLRVHAPARPVSGRDRAR